MILTEQSDALLAEMVQKLVENDYEFEGDADAFDPAKFVAAVASIATEDDTLAEGVGAWLTEAVGKVKALTEAAVEEGGGALALPPKGKHHMNSAGLRKFVKSATSRKMRRMAKKDPENAPTKRPIGGYAD